MGRPDVKVKLPKPSKIIKTSPGHIQKSYSTPKGMKKERGGSGKVAKKEQVSSLHDSPAAVKIPVSQNPIRPKNESKVENKASSVFPVPKLSPLDSKSPFIPKTPKQIVLKSLFIKIDKIPNLSVAIQKTPKEQKKTPEKNYKPKEAVAKKQLKSSSESSSDNNDSSSDDDDSISSSSSSSSSSSDNSFNGFETKCRHIRQSEQNSSSRNGVVQKDGQDASSGSRRSLRLN